MNILGPTSPTFKEAIKSDPEVENWISEFWHSKAAKDLQRMCRAVEELQKRNLFPMSKGGLGLRRMPTMDQVREMKGQ